MRSSASCLKASVQLARVDIPPNDKQAPCAPPLVAAGVVTAVAIQCAPKPASVQLAFLSCPSFAAVQQVLKHAKQSLGEILSAVEFLDQESMDMATQHLPGVSNPLTQAGPDAAQQQQQQDGLEPGGPFYMVVETQGSNAAHDKEKLEGFLEVGVTARQHEQHAGLRCAPHCAVLWMTVAGQPQERCSEERLCNTPWAAFASVCL